MLLEILRSQVSQVEPGRDWELRDSSPLLAIGARYSETNVVALPALKGGVRTYIQDRGWMCNELDDRTATDIEAVEKNGGRIHLF